MTKLHRDPRWIAALGAAALWALCPAGLGAQGAGTFVEESSNVGRGFDPTKAFDSSGIDTVNTFNGNLNLAIPVGLEYPVGGGFGFGMALRYNSSVWDFTSFPADVVPFNNGDEPSSFDLCATYSQAWPSWTFNAGMGWELSLGRFYESGPFALDDPFRQAVDGVGMNRDQPAVYIGPDGARHEFFPTLHDPQPILGGLPHYTRDGSYLRLSCSNPIGAGSIGGCVELEIAFPHGGRRLFERDPREPEGHGWRVKRIEDAFGNHVRVLSYGDPADPTALADRTWHLQDSQGRNYWIDWIAPPVIPGSELGERAFGREVVSRVDVPGVGGARLVYEFHYDDHRINRSCEDNYPWGRNVHRPRRYGGSPGDTVDSRESQIWVRKLTRISMPDGTDYAFEYNDSDGPDPCVVGLLKGVRLPTGGATEWDYNGYTFPTLEECPPHGSPDPPELSCSAKFTPATVSYGVVERRLLDFGGAVAGTWTYEPFLSLDEDDAFPVCGDLRVLSTIVTDPLGHQTQHFYSGYVQGEDDLGRGWRRTEYGLPFTRMDSIDPPEGERLFLSNRRLECSSPAVCSEVSRTYVRYELDPTGLGECDRPGVTFDYCQATNARIQASRTVYTDPELASGEHSVHSENSIFDGLGHYRKMVTTAGNLPGSAGRTTFTTYNPGSGPLVVDHDAGTASPFSPPANWLLETFTERRVTEGALTELQQFDFDPQTGFLRRVRVFKNTESNPPQPHAEDVITVFTRDAQGNETKRERHGGAFDPVQTSGGLAGLSLGKPEYRVDQTWSHGVLQRSQWVNPDDTSETLSIVNNTSIDQSTGLVLQSADPSGLATSYGYDLLGRLTDILATHDLAARIEYDLLGPVDPINPRPVGVRVGRGLRATADTAAEPEQLYLFDGLGRLETERTRLPGSEWSEQITGYLGDGSVSWVTDRHPLGIGSTGCPSAPVGTPARGCTRNLFHDAFGRPTRVIAPDGAPNGKRTDFAHLGIRKTVTKHWGVALDLGVASSSAERHEIRDFAGRLVEVHERSAGDSSLVKTSYAYDAGGRLIRVTPGGTSQKPRLFSYDGRGFLLSERHPEMATIAAQTLASLLWDDHDSLGNPGRRTDGDSDVSYGYDFAGRLIRIFDENLEEPLAEYFYARGNHSDGRGGLSRSAGKLHQSRRYNIFSSTSTVVITETFEYSAPEGRLSRTSLRSSQGNGDDVRFTLELGYDALGELATVAYPNCEGPARCDPGLAPRRIRRTTERGLLRKVDDITGGVFPYAASVTYDASGLATTVARGNGVTDSTTVDPSGIPRPREIAFNGPAGLLWTSGVYSYDGLGNAFRIGADRYRYDPVGRLLEGEVFAGVKRQVLEYDRVGNITSIGTTDRPAYSPAVDSLTNRLAEAGIAYSPAGKLIGFRDRSLTYDALERPVAMEGQGVNVRWAYDAGGERVALFDLMNRRETWTLRGPGDRVLRRYRTDDTEADDLIWRVQDYVYQGSRLLARVDDQGVRHLHPDHLGTPRLVTDAVGNELTRHTYYPFGEEAFQGDVDHAARRRDETMRFTGHERDVNGESAADPAIDDLDYMHARYYSPFYGRFLTLDPVTGTPADPQSWNRYAYVRGNPLTFLDPTGLDLKNGLVQGLWVEGSFFGYKLMIGNVSEADWENGRGFWHPESDVGFFGTVSRPRPEEGKLSWGLGVAAGGFAGTGNIESFEGSSTSGSAGVVATVGFSLSDTTDDVVIFGGLGASVHPLLAHMGASESTTSVLSVKDIFPGLFPSAGGTSPRFLFMDQITVRDEPLEILDPAQECPHLDGPCIEPLPIPPLVDVQRID